MVALSDRNECGEDMVAGCMLVVKRGITKPVSQRIDTERRVMNEAQPENASINVATTGVAPEEPGNHSGDDETHEEDERDVMAVLPFDDVVLAQITDVGNARLSAGLDKHPTDMAPVKTFVGVVGIEVGIGVSVVNAMAI